MYVISSLVMLMKTHPSQYRQTSESVDHRIVFSHSISRVDECGPGQKILWNGEVITQEIVVIKTILTA